MGLRTTLGAFISSPSISGKEQRRCILALQVLCGRRERERKAVGQAETHEALAEEGEDFFSTRTV